MAGVSRPKDGVASARLYPAIHVVLAATPVKTRMPGTSSAKTRFCPGMTSFRHKRRPRLAPYCIRRSRLEKAVSGVPGGALLAHGQLQPLDFRRHQRDALGQFLDRQQRQVLPDLVGDFLSRLVVVLDRHALSSAL